MSLYRQQQTALTDLNVVEECLKEMPRAKHGIVNKAESPRQGNFTPVRHKTSVNLIGFMGDSRPEKAQLVIPREQAASNDVGFLQEKPEGPITIHISNADKVMHFNDKWVADLKKRYVEKKSRQLAIKNNLVFKGKKQLPNGKTRLIYVMA